MGIFFCIFPLLYKRVARCVRWEKPVRSGRDGPGHEGRVVRSRRPRQTLCRSGDGAARAGGWSLHRQDAAELSLLRPDSRRTAKSPDHIAATASNGRVLGDVQGALPRKILLLLSADRIGGILSGLSPLGAALAGDTAVARVAGNPLRGHRQRSIGGEPAPDRLCWAAVGRRGAAVSRKPGAVG